MIPLYYLPLPSIHLRNHRLLTFPVLYPTGLPPPTLCSVVRLCGVSLSTASSYCALYLLLQLLSLSFTLIHLPPRYLNSSSNLFVLSPRQSEFGFVLVVIDQATVHPPHPHLVLVIPFFFFCISPRMHAPSRIVTRIEVKPMGLGRNLGLSNP